MPRTRSLAWSELKIGIIAVIAIALAVMLNQHLKGRALLRTLYFAPYILSEVVTGVVWPVFKSL